MRQFLGVAKGKGRAATHFKQWLDKIQHDGAFEFHR